MYFEMKAEVHVRARLNGEQESDGVPEVAEYEVPRQKTAPSNILLSQKKQNTTSREGHTDVPHLPMYKTDPNYSTVPSSTRVRTSTIQATNPSAQKLQQTSKIAVNKSLNAVGGLKATSSKGYTTVSPKTTSRTGMEFQEPAQPDSNSFDQVNMDSSNSSGTEGAGNLDALGSKLAVLPGAKQGMQMNTSRNKKVNSFVDSGSSATNSKRSLMSSQPETARTNRTAQLRAEAAAKKAK